MMSTILSKDAEEEPRPSIGERRAALMNKVEGNGSPQNLRVEVLDRLEEFMEEPVLQSESKIPISRGNIGYERSDSNISYDSALTPDRTWVTRRPGSLDQRGRSFLRLPSGPMGMSDIDAQSDLESVDTISSDEYAPSSQSSYNKPFEDAVAEFVSLLTRDDALAPLYRAASLVVSAERFQRNFARLLRKYAKQLKKEARNREETAIAMFVRRSALLAANAVTRHFFSPDKVTGTLLHQLATIAPNKANLVEKCLSTIDSPEENSSDDDNSYTSTCLDEYLPEDITKFMVQSKAFSCLRYNLRAFLEPSQNVSHQCNQVASDTPIPPSGFGDLQMTSSPLRKDIGAGEEADVRQAGIEYITGSRTSTGLSEAYSDNFFLNFIVETFLQYCVLCLEYLISLISPREWQRHGSNQSSYKLIYVYDVDGKAHQAELVLDTGANLNVISFAKVSQLGKISDICYDQEVYIKGADGDRLESQGSLELWWSLKKNSPKHKERFFVVGGCPSDILFGEPYIAKLGLIIYTKRLLHTVYHKKPKQTNADKEAEKRRQEEKAALEAKKLSAKQQVAVPSAQEPQMQSVAPAQTPGSSQVLQMQL